MFEYASPLFVDAAKTPLPPFRAINHEIPIIDDQRAIRLVDLLPLSFEFSSAAETHDYAAREDSIESILDGTCRM